VDKSLDKATQTFSDTWQSI